MPVSNLSMLVGYVVQFTIIIPIVVVLLKLWQWLWRSSYESENFCLNNPSVAELQGMNMENCIHMNIIVILFVYFTMTVNTVMIIAAEEGYHDCKPTRCNHNGPDIRFPFSLRDKQPDHCGYPGFELSCTTNHKRHTVLELSGSVKLFVKHINYTSQQIHVYDPHACLPRQLLYLNISASPFQFVIDEHPDEHPYDFETSFSFFNCSSSTRHGDSTFWPSETLIPCLSSTHGSYKVVAYRSYYKSSWLDISSCKKMHDTSPFPETIIDSDKHDVYLNWSKPMCSECAAQGEECKISDRDNSTTECFYIPNHNQGTESKKLMITGIVLGSFIAVLAGAIGVYCLHHSNKTEKENQMKIEKFLQDYRALKPTRYSYADLKRITNQFKDKIGQGGYGTVYKGRLSNEVIVAVKLLNNFKGNGEEFTNEVGSMGTIHHFNVAHLVGFCADGVRRALVYEFLPNGSLDKYIFSADHRKQQSHNNLGLEKLQDIALGIAKGIDYLHQGCDQQIIHLDIKPHNILLDHNFNPKISDFGMAKLCSKEQSAVSMTAARGTMGYIAPEVLSRNFGNVSYKSDVYSFGMLLLEIVGGRKNIDVKADNISQVYFPEWVYKRLNKDQDDLGIENIVEEGQFKIARKLIIVGLWCIQWYPVDRPSMNKVVRMLELEGDNVDDLVMPPNPFASRDSTKGSSTMHRRPIHSTLEIISESD